jgi:hypothetical protein
MRIIDIGPVLNGRVRCTVEIDGCLVTVTPAVAHLRPEDRAMANRAAIDLAKLVANAPETIARLTEEAAVLRARAGECAACAFGRCCTVHGDVGQAAADRRAR